MVLARLKVAYGQNERGIEVQHLPHGLLCAAAADDPEFRIRRIRDHADVRRRDIISAQNRVAGEIAYSEDMSGAFDGRGHGQAKLCATRGREILGILKKTDIVDRDHRGYPIKYRRGVLNVYE